jgi:hypothetical protein
MGLNEPALGTCQTCSLISPVVDIETHDNAVNIASQVMEALFVPAQADRQREAMLRTAQPMTESVMNKPMSRRDLLLGAFLEK